MGRIAELRILFLIVTARSPSTAQLTNMSFQDDLFEPEAIESAAHFTELVRVANERVISGEELVDARRERIELRRALPRDLGN